MRIKVRTQEIDDELAVGEATGRTTNEVKAIRLEVGLGQGLEVVVVAGIRYRVAKHVQGRREGVTIII